MTRARTIDQNGNIEELGEREFFTRVFGHPPLTPEQRAQQRADHEAWIERYKDETKRELAELQERIDATRQVLRDQRERDMEALKALPPLKFEVMQASLSGEPLVSKRRRAA
jgi:hypothetical protein